MTPLHRASDNGLRITIAVLRHNLRSPEPQYVRAAERRLREINAEIRRRKETEQ